MLMMVHIMVIYRTEIYPFLLSCSKYRQIFIFKFGTTKKKKKKNSFCDYFKIM